MKFVGFNFKKIAIEKKSEPNKDTKISTKMDILNISSLENRLFKGKDLIMDVSFVYEINYNPEIAKIQYSLEKLKKKQSQIDNMQKKMMKPQMILFPISFSYIIIWYLFLIPTFQANAVAVVPGIVLNMTPSIPNGIPVFIWYMVCSFFFGTLASRVIGVTPIA